MDPISLLVGLLVIVGTGSLAKVGENITDETVKLGRSLWSVLRRQVPDSQTARLIEAGREIDYQQAVIDVEAIALDSEVIQLLAQIEALLATNQELATQVKQLVTQGNTTNIQIAAKNFETEELDAEVEQKMSTSQSQGDNQQTGFDNVKIKGKATIKLNQQIN